MKKCRKRKFYTEEFKQQLVLLYNSGYSRTSLVEKYGLTASTLNRWILHISDADRMKRKESGTPFNQELLTLQRKIQQLEMENNTLKQATLILKQKRR